MEGIGGDWLIIRNAVGSVESGLHRISAGNTRTVQSEHPRFAAQSHRVVDCETQMLGIDTGRRVMDILDGIIRCPCGGIRLDREGAVYRGGRQRVVQHI